MTNPFQRANPKQGAKDVSHRPSIVRPVVGLLIIYYCTVLFEDEDVDDAIFCFLNKKQNNESPEDDDDDGRDEDGHRQKIRILCRMLWEVYSSNTIIPLLALELQNDTEKTADKKRFRNKPCYKTWHNVRK